MLKEKGAAIEGIQTALFITDLFKIRSAPEQKLSFEKASLGGLNIHDGKIEFQIESTGSLLIEKSSFGWCDGNVYTQAMRISPKIKDYNLILYCDRLKLAMILEQFGAVKAEGNGTVNGRLPIRIKNGKIRFKDGFLFDRNRNTYRRYPDQYTSICSNRACQGSFERLLLRLGKTKSYYRRRKRIIAVAVRRQTCTTLALCV
jgi:hypothetical protein